ncbi:crt_membr, carotene biosynthesis associated membrane protein [Acidimicrobiia bacterium]
MAITYQRARAAVIASPELRRWSIKARRIVYGDPTPQEISFHDRPKAPTAEPESRRLWQTGLAALSGLLGSLIIAASAPSWRWAVPSWRLSIPGIAQPGSTTQSTTFFLIGLILLAAGWLGLIYRAGRPGDPRRVLVIVGIVIAIWAIPVSLGPPLLSNDVYSYVAQGEMASRGLDPSSVGPVALGRGDFTTAADPVWRPAPAPYGPVAVATSRAVVELSGHNAATSVWVYRLVVLLGVAMAAVGVSLIASRNGLAPAVAVAIGIGNPIVILHLIGGIHNDALMFGLLALGLAVVQRDRLVLGVALLTAATAVKIPAAVALVYVGWCWRGSIATVRERITTTASVLLASVSAIVAACLVVGLSPGWITALKSTGKVNDTYSPTTKIGFSIAEILNAVGLNVDGSTFAAGVRALGLLATVVVAMVMLLRSPRIGYIKATGVVLVAYVILGPVIWPWYLPAGFALLAACGLGRYRPSYLVVCIAASWFVWPTSVLSIQGFGGGYQHLRGLGVVLLVMGLAYGAQRLASRWEANHWGSQLAEESAASTNETVSA